MSDQVYRPNKAQQEQEGLPPAIKFWSMGQFGGMNYRDARTAIKDNEAFWRENLIRIGPGTLRTLWDVGPAFYVSPQGNQIIKFFWYTIAGQQYCAVFFADGTALQVAYSTGAVVSISGSPGTFWLPNHPYPSCCSHGDEHLLISSRVGPNAYWVWDGTLLYSAGSTSPDITISSGGAGYTSAPTVVAFGGSGVGAQFTALVENGVVSQIVTISPGAGYKVGDVVQLQFIDGGTDTGPILEAVLTAGTVASVVVSNAGSGYTDGTYALSFSGGGGTGAAGTYTVTSGKVVSTAITDIGAGYTDTPTVSFPSGGGVNAAGLVTISKNSVGSVTVLNGGTGFQGTPTITFQGGGGTGATGVASITAGRITGVTMTEGGSDYSTPPGVVVQPGVNNSAYASVAIMPFGVSGRWIESFLNRIWLFDPFTQTSTSGATILASVASSHSDFSASDGGIFFTSLDPFLRSSFHAGKQANGYLYCFGDSSVSVISNVQTTASGTTVATTFTIQNVDPQVGGFYPEAIQYLGRSMLFPTANGIYGLFGGEVRKMSGDVDGLFATPLLFMPDGISPIPQNSLSGAIASIHAHLCYLLAMPVTDPQGVVRTVLLTYDEEAREFFIASQTLTSIAFVGTLVIGSNYTAYATDGQSIFPMFQVPSALEKSIYSKAYGMDRPFMDKQLMTLYLSGTDVSERQAGISLNVTFSSYGIAQQIGSSASELPAATAAMPVQPNFIAPNGQYPLWRGRTPDIFGPAIAATITSTSHDFVLSTVGCAYQDVATEFG